MMFTPGTDPMFTPGGALFFSDMSIPILISNASAATSNTSSVTTGAIDTTGASFLIAGVSNLDTTLAAVVTDSKGNVWTPLNDYSVGESNARAQLFYSIPSSVGIGHTFTATQSGSFPCMCVAGFSGVAPVPFDQQNGTASPTLGTVSTFQPGSITPTQDNELIVAYLGMNVNAVTAAINSGMSITDQIAFASGTAFGGAMAYLVQSPAVAINPTWSFGACRPSGVIASFKASTAPSNDNILAMAVLSTAQGTPVKIKAANVSSVYTIDVASDGLVAIIIPGVMQASNQDQPAPLLAKDNGDGTYSLVII